MGIKRFPSGYPAPPNPLCRAFYVGNRGPIRISMAPPRLSGIDFRVNNHDFGLDHLSKEIGIELVNSYALHPPVGHLAILAGWIHDSNTAVAITRCLRPKRELFR